MEQNLKPVLFYGFLAFMASFLLAFYVPKLKRGPVVRPPQVYGTSTTPKPTTIVDIKSQDLQTKDQNEAKVEVKGETTVPVQKVLTLTEDELNQKLNEASKEKKAQTDTVKAGINSSNVLLYVSSQGIQINIKLKLTKDKKSLEVESYNLTGVDGYDEAVKREFANLIASGVTSAVTNGLKQADIIEIILSDKSLAVVYTQN